MLGIVQLTHEMPFCVINKHALFVELLCLLYLQWRSQDIAVARAPSLCMHVQLVYYILSYETSYKSRFVWNRGPKRSIFCATIISRGVISNTGGSNSDM